MASKPLLTLETLEPERPFLLIDGEPYELALLGDFGLTEQARLGRLMAQALDIENRDKVIAGDDITKATDREFLARRAEDLLDETVGMILRAPAPVRIRLTAGQKLAVLEAFSPTVQKAATAPKPETRRPSTSGSSSRRSRRPMAPTRG